MATAIPSSMTFEMLSRLPPNSFVQVWKEIRPSVLPTDGKYEIGNSSQRVSFAMRGAPNEFLLNTNVYLCGSGYTMGKYTANGQALDASQVADLYRKVPVRFRAPFHLFQSSRESFNSGSLPYLDNQDTLVSHEFNELRKSLVRRAPVRQGGGPEDCQSWAAGGVGDKSLASLKEQQQDIFYTSDHFRGYFPGAAATPPTVFSAAVSGKNKEFRIPLGLYSNLVNTHSVIPLGLMSSYSVNGWQIDLDLQAQDPTKTAGGPAYVFDASVGLTKADGTVATYTRDPAVLPKAVLRDLRIYACVIKVLDPSVMEAVLSLYEKREMVNVGGVQFPLSLRLNSLGYRLARFPLVSGQSDYYFRITGTDRSVRALAWRVFSTTASGNGQFVLPSSIQLTRLETTIGSEQPHPVIEDTRPETSNVNNFLQMNIKRSSALFSPLPYYQEAVLSTGDYADDWAQNNNLLSAGGTTIGTGASADYAVRPAVSMGMISFENLDRREADFSGSFQASGKDLTNVGAIELRMRFNQVGAIPAATSPSTLDGLEALTFIPPAVTDYAIVFAYVYDSVMEISPQGVMEITNAVL